MDNPPPYSENAKGAGNSFDDAKIDSNGVKHLSIREEVGVSRSQHVASLVAKLLPQIRERAKQGLSRSTLLLLPADLDAARKGKLVGFPEDEQPLVIQLEGHQDNAEFWMQQEAIDELRRQMLAALASDMPPPQLPERPTPPPAMKTSFWGRKQSKSPQVQTVVPIAPDPIVIQIAMDDVHFRTETEYGLYETLRGRGVLINVVVR